MSLHKGDEQRKRRYVAARTKAGLAAARAQGRVGGNPALQSRDPVVLRKSATREQTRLTNLLPGADAWLAVVRRLRPAKAWDEVTAAVRSLRDDYLHCIELTCYVI